MSNSFTITVRNPEIRLKQGREAAKRLGVELTGDVNAGTVNASFPVKIKIRYTALGNDQYEVEVLQKPILLPMAMIESKIREALSTTA